MTNNTQLCVRLKTFSFSMPQCQSWCTADRLRGTFTNSKTNVLAALYSCLCFSSCCFLLCAERLMCRVCFKSFSELTLNLNLTPGCTFRICDITTRWRQSWTSMQLTQVWCGNSKIPVHKHWEWTSLWWRKHLVSSSSTCETKNISIFIFTIKHHQQLQIHNNTPVY